MSPSTNSYDSLELSTPPSTPKRLILARSTSSIPFTPPRSPYTPTLTRSFSDSSTSSFSSSRSTTSRPSSPFLSPPSQSQYESRHPSESIYRKFPDSPKPHYFYERPGFFTPKRSAPKAPGEKRGTLIIREGDDYGEEDEDEE